jgi:hypothetical protein
MYDHDAGNRADETGDRSDGQIDVACDDHHHHADGEDEDVAVLDHQVGDVLGLQQNAVGQSREGRSPGLKSVRMVTRGPTHFSGAH